MSLKHRKDYTEEQKAKCLEMLSGDTDACAFVSKIRYMAIVWDDLVDKDREVSRIDIIKLIWTALFDITYDAFYKKHESFLFPILTLMASEWIATQGLEHNPKSETDIIIAFVLRTGTHLIMSCLLLTGGINAVLKHGADLLRLSHIESLEDYRHSLKGVI